MNFYSNCQSKIENNWDHSKISQIQVDISNKVTTCFASISAILSILISYKVRKRRLLITINFVISGIVFLFYLLVNENSYWLVIVLRGINGISLGFFQSVHISYIIHFASGDSLAFHGCLIQFAMFLSLIILNLMIYALSWKVIVAIISVQSFAFSGLIWIVPESPVLSKSFSGQQIYRHPHLKYLIVMISIMVIQCFSGIGFMVDNCPRLMQKIGIEMDSSLYSVLTNFIGCLSTLICSFIIDIIGVRYLWAFSGFGLVISLVLYAITLKANCPNWLGVFAVFLYFLFFGFGEGPIPWLLCGVIFPEVVMIESGGINCFMNRFMDIWFGYLLNAITKRFGEFGSVIFNAAFSLVGALVGLVFIPALKNIIPENTTLL